MPADRPEIQDHAATRALHRRRRRLRREEEVAQVHCHPLVPIGGRDLFDRVAIVIGGVVDEDIDATQLCFDRGDHRLHRVYVAQVYGVEDRGDIGVLEAGDQRLALRHGDVAEGDMRALADEGLDQPFAAATAADEDAFAPKTGINGAHAAASFNRPRLARLVMNATRP